MREVQRVMQYVQKQEATAGGVAGLPDDVEGVLGEDPALIDDDPNNKPPSLVERRAAATRGVDGADGVMKSITPEDINAAEANVAKLTGDLAGLTGDELTHKALDVALAQAKLDGMKTTLAQARGDKADARTTRHVNDVWYWTGSPPSCSRSTVTRRSTTRRTPSSRPRPATGRPNWTKPSPSWPGTCPWWGGTVDVAWGLWRPVGRVTVDLARALDHVFGPP
jgi:hypothetical protein